MGSMAQSLSSKLEDLSLWFRQHGEVTVAYSGGVDSALLFYVGTMVLGVDKCNGFLGDSFLISEAARTSCLQFADEHHLDVCSIALRPLGYNGFPLNDADRCYICKKHTYTTFLKEPFLKRYLLDGTNLDDLKQDRPGFKVLSELCVATPYLDCCLTKADIRSISYHLGLATWDKLSDSCLATRVPVGVEIQPALLQTIEFIEFDLLGLGLSGCRVVPDGSSLSVTVRTGQIEQILNTGTLKHIKEIALKYNFDKVFLDLFEREGILPSLLDNIGFVRGVAPSERFLEYFSES